MKSKVLILGNPMDHEGGMVEFNRGLINSINHQGGGVVLQPVVIGSRMSLFYYPVLKKILYPFYYCYDVIRITIKLVVNKNIKIVQLNPSLIPIPILRDSIVGFIAKWVFRKKIVLVLHGWKDYFYTEIADSRVFKRLLLVLFNRSDIIYVLANEFKTKLVTLGLNEEKIKITSTFFVRETIPNVYSNHEDNHVIRFIFLGRISKLKGIDELVTAIKEYNKLYSNFSCILIGHEDKPGVFEGYKKMVQDNGLSEKVLFAGRILGPKKFEMLSQADIFIFPSHTEGCPTSVIEALASGLFVISTKVGAINEIINETNGIKVNPGNSTELVHAMYEATEKIGTIRSLRRTISADAHKKYEVGIIANEFLKTYAELINN